MNMVGGNNYAHLKHCKNCVVNFYFVLRCYMKLLEYHYKTNISIPQIN